MRGELGDKGRLQHIIEAISKIQLFVSEVSEHDFLNDEIKILAS